MCILLTLVLADPIRILCLIYGRPKCCDMPTLDNSISYALKVLTDTIIGRNGAH